jgi:(p)ppGpp synthase/HD superfamily hydrolase
MVSHLKVFSFASSAHAGQTDKAGLPYIFHPLAVAALVNRIPSFALLSEETQSDLVDAALLHDVVEDTKETLESIKTLEVSELVLNMVEVLTHIEGEERGEYIRRVAAHPYARIVKLADLAHNASSSRLDKLDEKTKAKLTAKYSIDIPIVCEGSPEDLIWVKTQTDILN